MNRNHPLTIFPDRTLASEAAAELIADSLQEDLQPGKRCSLVVSGGSTPGPCFDTLSAIPLAWENVTVIPSDERWVPADHPDSNERMIRKRLLHGPAAAGHFLPLYRETVEADQAIPLIRQDLETLPAAFSCTLLGMGEDGHFASLFPDFSQLEEALDPNYKEPCLVVRTAGSPHLRISLSLAVLLTSKQTLLLIFGQEKRRVFEAAAEGNARFPISSLLRLQTGPLTVLWAP